MSLDHGWTSVPHDFINLVTETKVRGVWVREMPSPSDLPSHIRFLFKPEHDDKPARLIIELRYLTTSEPTRDVSVDGAKVALGKNSRRIFKIAQRISIDHEAALSSVKAAVAYVLTNLKTIEPQISTGNLSALEQYFVKSDADFEVPLNTLNAN